MCNIKEEMNSAKEQPTVKQLEIMNAISSPKYRYIFFIEGKDDIPCYRSWFGKINSDFLNEVELINLNNKEKVLGSFWEYMDKAKERSGVADKIYAIVDHDFDGYKKYEKHDRIYLDAEVYSIENIVCSEPVLEEILKCKFLCNNDNQIIKIKEKYRTDLAHFIELTKSINEKIFFSKLLDKKVKINDISLDFCDRNFTLLGIKNKDNLLELDESFNDIPKSDKDRLSSCFIKLDPEKQYRGKFLFAFFRKWLTLLGMHSGIPSLKICNFSDGDVYNNIKLSKSNIEHKSFISEKKITNDINQWSFYDYCLHSFPSSHLKDFISKIISNEQIGKH